jgi:PadR family transcriptional regulator, regulatory protein PadR
MVSAGGAHADGSRWTRRDRNRRGFRLSDDVLRVEEGSLYPALYRMEEQGLIEAEWRPTENNRTAKFYALTRKGRRAAQAELDGWLRLSGAVARVLRALEQEA